MNKKIGFDNPSRFPQENIWEKTRFGNLPCFPAGGKGVDSDYGGDDCGFEIIN